MNICSETPFKKLTLDLKNYIIVLEGVTFLKDLQKRPQRESYYTKLQK